MTYVVITILILLASYLVPRLGLYIDEHMTRLIFHPPSGVHKPEYNREHMITLPTPSGQNLFMLLLHPKDPPRHGRFIVFSYGTGDCVDSLLAYAQQMSDALHAVVVLYDYVGYGRSQGKPSEKGCYESLDTVMRTLIPLLLSSHPPLLVGHSLGTGVVVEYATRNHWTAPIVLLSPYKSMIRIGLERPHVRAVVPQVLLSMIAWCLSPIDKFNSYARMGRLRTPVKIYHGMADTLIDASHSRDLYEVALNKGSSPAPTYFPLLGHDFIRERVSFQDWEVLFIGGI